MAVTTLADGVHPRMLVTEAERPVLERKLREVDWAREAYGKLRERVAPYVERHRTDPTWITSRMLMNWDSHAVTPIVEKDKWVRGEGRAPVPTPRYAGQRDWAGKYSLPGIDELKPHNDKGGLIWAHDRNGVYAWVHPSLTGHSIEGRNRGIMGLARDASFVYWLTGDADYARFAADILWSYVYGFSFKQLPHGPDGKVVGEDGGPRNIYGTQTFEVIHDHIVRDIALAYDFLYDYLVKEGRDVVLIQRQLKRMADRVVEGGGREGNWNLHQADIIAHAILALEDDGAYEDGKGRQHYLDILLHADLPHQLGLEQVIRTGYDQETGIWPESFGYGTGVTVSITEIASLVARQQQGASVLDDPLLTKAALVQFQWLHPNGRSIGLGDTTHAHAPTSPLELLVAHARRTGQPEREAILTAALRQEMAGGRYVRGKGAGLVQLCLYVPELSEVQGRGTVGDRVFHGAPLNALIQRNLGSTPAHSLMAALYGTRGGHTHANGLALELFGAGEIVGPDSGVGSSYWQKDHGEYYRQRPAHNTVIVDGQSRGDQALSILSVEPEPGGDGVSPNIGFADVEMIGGTPKARQRRCVALVRTSETGGFYLDVFRSLADSPEHQSHDYIYHGAGQRLVVADLAGQPVPLAPTRLLGSEHGDQKGYDYFREERSLAWSDGFRASIAADLGTRTVNTSVWMLGAPDRQVFALSAPKIIRANRGGMPKAVAGLPLPALLVRQRREAWDVPFVAVFDSFDERDGAGIRTVKPLAGLSGSCVGVEVELAAAGHRVLLVHDDCGESLQPIAEGGFRGTFGAVVTIGGGLQELYMGQGMSIAHGGAGLAATDGKPVQASLRQEGGGWVYASSAPVRVRLPGDHGFRVLPKGTGEVPLAAR